MFRRRADEGWLSLLIWAFADQVAPPTSGENALDLEAVERMARGDANGLTALYDRHSRAIFSLAFRILRDQADAEETVQDVFSQAWRQAARYETRRGAPAAWLLMMTRSRAIDRLRSRRAAAPPGGDVHTERLAEFSSPDVAPDVQVVSADQAARLRRAMNELPAVQRLAIELAFFEGLTHAEVAERLEQPLGTVKTRIRLGLMRLRDAMQEASL
jgi:RNA polymerase sigma-70 factor (ECF subfamily)